MVRIMKDSDFERIYREARRRRMNPWLVAAVAAWWGALFGMHALYGILKWSTFQYAFMFLILLVYHYSWWKHPLH